MSVAVKITHTHLRLDDTRSLRPTGTLTRWGKCHLPPDDHSEAQKSMEGAPHDLGCDFRRLENASKRMRNEPRGLEEDGRADTMVDTKPDSESALPWEKFWESVDEERDCTGREDEGRVELEKNQRCVV